MYCPTCETKPIIVWAKKNKTMIECKCGRFWLEEEMGSKKHPLQGTIRKLCGACNACGCDECFATGKCRVSGCGASQDRRWTEVHTGKSWEKASAADVLAMGTLRVGDANQPKVQGKLPHKLNEEQVEALFG